MKGEKGNIYFTTLPRGLLGNQGQSDSLQSTRRRRARRRRPPASATSAPLHCSTLTTFLQPRLSISHPRRSFIFFFLYYSLITVFFSLFLLPRRSTLRVPPVPPRQQTRSNLTTHRPNTPAFAVTLLQYLRSMTAGRFAIICGVDR